MKQRADRSGGGTIVIAGGGTGGHVYPGIAVARELRRRDADRPLLWVGALRGLETRLVPAEGIPLLALPLGGLAGKSPAARLRGAALAGLGVARCLVRFGVRRPAAVLGVGGFASGPAALAAAMLGVPLVLHEQNLRPGGTNRFLSRFARATAVSFEETLHALRARRVELTGNPVREEFFAAPPASPAGETRSLLVFGGSRGARSINRSVAAALPLISSWRSRLRIVHQTGQADLEEARRAHAAAGFDSDVRAFLEDLPRQMAAADLVVCRAGASTVFELAAAGRPAVLVPFPHAAGGHQAANALSLQGAGAAVVVEDAELSGGRLAALLEELLPDPAKLARMGAAARRLARPDAAALIAGLVEQAAAGLHGAPRAGGGAS